MAIIKRQDIYDDSKSAFDNLLKDLDKLNSEVVTLTKSNKGLSESLQTVKKSGNGTEAKELVKLTNQLNNATNKLSVSQNKQAETLEKVKIESADLRKLNKANAILNNKLAGTEEKLAANNTKLRLERKKLNTETKNGQKDLKRINDELDRNNAKIEKNSDKLKAQKIGIGRYTAGLKTMGLQLFTSLGLMGGLAGAIGGLKNIIGSTAEGQIFLAKVTGATNAILATFRDKIISSWNALTDFNSGADDTRSFMERLGDSIVDVVSVRMNSFVTLFDAGADLLKGNFKEALSGTVDGFIALGTGAENATGETKKLLEEMQRMAAFGAAISAGEKQLELERSEFAIREAKDLRTIADLRVKAADKANISAKDRQKAIEKAIQLTKFLGLKNEEFAKREESFQVAKFNAHNSNVDDAIELNRIKLKGDNVAAASLKKLKLLTAELQTVNIQAAKDNEFIIDNKALADIAAVDAEIERQSKLDDELLQMEEEFQEEKSEIQDIAKDEAIVRAEDLADAEEAIKQQALESGTQLARDIFNSFQDEKLAKINSDAEAEKLVLQDKLDKGLISQDEFTKGIAKIEQKQRIASAKAEKSKALFDIAIATAVAVAKAGFITPAAIAVLAAGAIQAAAVLARPIPKLEKGEVNIGGKSHAEGGNIVEVERGESYINKHATANSEGLLNMINNGLITDKSIPIMNNQNNNMLLASLLMNGNNTNKQLLQAMLNMGYSYDKKGVRHVIRADGSMIENFNIDG